MKGGASIRKPSPAKGLQHAIEIAYGKLNVRTIVLERGEDVVPQHVRVTPRLAVVMIGTNNIGLSGQTGEQAATGVAAVVATLRKKLP